MACIRELVDTIHSISFLGEPGRVAKNGELVKEFRFSISCLAVHFFKNSFIIGLPWWHGEESACQFKGHNISVQSLVQEDSTCHRATELMCHATESTLQSL